MTRTLADVAAEAATCTKCRLSQGRTQVVFGVGDPHADLMFIGEGPGFHEDRQGEPFVGAAGQLLTRMLGEIGLTREQVYIGNILKCLRYNATIQLGDGSWERIGRLVRSRYRGTVMSVDADGRLVPKHVVGWHTSPVAGRRILKLTYRSAKRAGAGKVSVQLTEDHPVLTRRGYVPARDLVPDDEVNTGQGMSQVAFDVACGTILGDGHLNRKSAHLAFAHSQRQRDWALFKATALEAFSPQVSSLEVSAVAGGPQIYPVVHVRTRAHRAFGILRSNFYGARKRVPLWMAERLNPRMLAVWYLDDGHLRERPGRRSSAEIATHGFDGHDLALLRAGLGRLGVISQVRAGRLVFGVDATRTLTDLIAPYVPESMRYKLPRDIAMSRPFRPEAYEPGPDVALFDSVVVEDVTHEPRTDTTAYCLDVADTHNFVTAGGVVHNCRPPGNRDPQPDEIEACTPWLVEQISLIQPRVIVTLGNFATKFVLNTETGITRLRGQVHGWHGRTVIPTFHPAAILHGGGEKSRQFQLLLDDFRLVRRTLDELDRVPPSRGDDAPAEVPTEVPDVDQLELF
jgi:uracil-DNA glycosylase